MKLDTSNKTNGVDTTQLRETVNAVEASPNLGHFKFQIENYWIDAGENRSEVRSFYGCGEALTHKHGFTLAADEPPILLGNDNGANPVEHLLHALASCLTTSMVYHAAARGIHLERVESSLEGDLDLRGFLGLDPNVRRGYEHIRVKLRIKARVTEEEWAELINLGPTFSPVYDSITNGVPISLSVEGIA